MPSEIAFYVLAPVTLVFAIAAMTLRRLVHCALCAAVAFAGLAMIYLQLDAEFVGFAQLMVYVGAIAILIVFAVLLTRGDEAQSSPSWLAGVAVAALALFAIVTAIIRSPSLQRMAPPAPVAPVQKIGEELMTRYVLPLEMMGVLLTGALLGAAVIAMRDEPEIQLPGRRRIEPVEELTHR
jgi:NADH-quinone oxidoreductase subunit J